MRIAVVTEAGELPIQSGELADEIAKRVGILATRGSIRKALLDIEMDVRKQTSSLGPEHS